MPSFGGIKRDCDSIVSELKSQLKSKLSNNETSPAEMSECVNLLLQLVIFKLVFHKISYFIYCGATQWDLFTHFSTFLN
jgi:hypothetical protein